MSETKFVTENKHERLVDQVARLKVELSKIRQELYEIKNDISPDEIEGEVKSETLPDLKLDEENPFW